MGWDFLIRMPASCLGAEFDGGYSTPEETKLTRSDVFSLHSIMPQELTDLARSEMEVSVRRGGHSIGDSVLLRFLRKDGRIRS